MSFWKSQSCPLAAYDNENKLNADFCAQDARDLQNTSIQDYRLFSTTAQGCDNNFQKCAIQNRNLWWKKGYGYTDGCVVDNDSEMRNNSKVTHDKHKTQLFTRNYVANPALGRGVNVPNLESRLIEGLDTTQIRQCDRLDEKTLDVFIPMISCLQDNVQNPDNIIPTWTWGGDNSRLLMRDSTVLQKVGYVHDGKTWTRNKDKPAEW